MWSEYRFGRLICVRLMLSSQFVNLLQRFRFISPNSNLVLVLLWFPILFVFSTNRSRLKSKKNKHLTDHCPLLQLCLLLALDSRRGIIFVCLRFFFVGKITGKYANPGSELAELLDSMVLRTMLPPGLKSNCGLV